MAITTKKQGELTRARIMTFIIEFICEHGYSPSYVEIMEGTGIKSKSTVSYQLLRLRDNGEINFIDCEPRTISVTGFKFVEEGEE